MKRPQHGRTRTDTDKHDAKTHRRLFRRQSVVELGGIDVPAKALLRGGEVRACLGVTWGKMNVLVEDGKLDVV